MITFYFAHFSCSFTRLSRYPSGFHFTFPAHFFPSFSDPTLALYRTKNREEAEVVCNCYVVLRGIRGRTLKERRLAGDEP